MTEPRLYVVMVTDGTVIEYAPEVYTHPDRAWLEAERWAWILAGGGWAEVSTPFPGRWEVAGRDVRLIEAAHTASLEELWVLTYWDEDGIPDPEATLQSGRPAARAWVTEDATRMPMDDLTELPWLITATYRHGGEEAYAVASRAKVVTGS